MHPVEIDIHEEFPRLSKAPIAEAALEIRARATGDWAEAGISSALRAQLPEYPHQEGRNIFQGEFAVESGKRPQHTLEDLGWCGVAARSEDKKQIAFFERDRFLFSRLEPYGRWDDFQAEALRLWNTHCTLACPMTLHRIGVRFVNRIPLPLGNVRLEDYLRVVPSAPAELPLIFTGFLHQDAMTVPGHDYDVSITRATQGTGSPTWTLIIDVDVFTKTPYSAEDADLEGRLQEMRWLKNKAFFGTVADKLKEDFR